MHSKEHLGKGGGWGHASKWAPSPGFDRFGPFFAWELPQREASWVQPPPRPRPDVGVHIWWEHLPPQKTRGRRWWRGPPPKQRPE